MPELLSRETQETQPRLARRAVASLLAVLALTGCEAIKPQPAAEHLIVAGKCGEGYRINVDGPVYNTDAGHSSSDLLTHIYCQQRGGNAFARITLAQGLHIESVGSTQYSKDPDAIDIAYIQKQNYTGPEHVTTDPRTGTITVRDDGYQGDRIVLHSNGAVELNDMDRVVWYGPAPNDSDTAVY